MAKLTQEAVAAHLQVTPRTVQRWEAGDVAVPDDKKLEMAELFGVDVSYMMGWSQPIMPADDNGNGAHGEAA